MARFIRQTTLVAVTSVWFAVGGVLFWHKSTDRFILLLSLGLVVVGGVFIQPFPTVLFQWNWVWAFPHAFLEFLAGATLIFGYTFPDGHFVPRWTRWLAFGWIALLRYRLWDIDRVINRTLVYALLSGILALIYVGLIIALQALLRGIINQTNDVAIVVSTLSIAALFQPLRQRIQRIVDRRFYRSKYDAAKTLTAFSATLRNEINLQQPREQLVAVVQETMQPTFVSLWLRPTQHDGKRTPWRANPPVSSADGAS